MITHRIFFKKSPTSIRLAAQGDTFVRETGPVAIEVPPGADGAGETENSAALMEAVQSLLEGLGELECRRQQSISQLRELAVELAYAMTAHVGSWYTGISRA